MIVVIVFNLVKLSCMLLALTKFDAEHLLATTGDAVVSFLQEKDPTTAGLCLANLRNMKSMWKTPGFAQPYHAPKRWQEAVSRGRWVVFFIIMFIALAIVAVLHAWGLTWLRKNDYNLDFTSLWSLGLGTVSQYTMVISPNDLRDGPDLAKFAVLANLPQVVLALIYFTYSTILTTMFIAADWSRFAFRPQTLMVSNSINDRQRGMWALGTPWPYAIILITMQVLLHWLVSQSLFVAQVFRMELDTTPYPEPVILNCGYSPIAIMCSMIVAGVMLLGVGTLMFRKFPDGAPPVASTNSAAISAACHSNEIDDAAAFKPLRWGAWEGMSGGVGHCSLMPDDVYQQGVGKMAADGQTYT
ncbi:hypothetical protein K469DRAFT_710481 [Zopfia rhizophila CBS 207.26]|uniref:Uncharacterized protein n=1 Tax=Zopfia rhizophila CBS 207.26 TaxID=1314779 RepID=A0A6A6DXD5_9PEZI|nr:hypothetical protein K469DRAFT_710481 [Zopfia rhizophila CBS 207.26]